MSVKAQEKYIHPKSEFLVNQTVMLFGNDVKLRKEPNTTSKTLQLLPILSKLTVLERTNMTFLYEGIESPWYKVKTTNNEEGYVVGGLLALDSKTVDNWTYLEQLKLKEEKWFAILRAMHGNSSEYIEITDKLANSMFSLKTYSNKRLEAIKNMIYIDYMAEACGEEGGGVYFFNNGVSLIKAVEVSYVFNADVYWLKETITFPNEQGGSIGKIVFSREEGETFNNDILHEKKTIKTKEFIWEGKELKLATSQE
ncbi:SH3 domain-containing protein [Tenacibaculum sp. MAR_2009_124]|uniref:SH3 domain-containing protein n=1 Tax=Tenacibaculum sp. MAR_2009_124 TaxID=1250059 RepID=UPI0015A0A575|nr:SH3 domain-containing protein [Tenacibaculum sp. MAR_2009_124]